MIHKENIKDILYLPKFELSDKFIKENNWCSVVLYDGPWLMDYEWMSNAFTEFGDENIYYVALNHKYERDLQIEYNKQTKELLKDFSYQHGWMYYLFVSPKNNGLVFQADEICVIAGHKEFLKIAHPISYETSKEIYFENVDASREETLNNFTKIWDKYALNNCL